jgi:hypothetical protein
MAKLVIFSYIIACLVELPFILSPKMDVGFGFGYILFVTWHWIPFSLLAWVDSFHPLGNLVFQGGLFVIQTLLITPLVFLLLRSVWHGGKKAGGKNPG